MAFVEFSPEFTPTLSKSTEPIININQKSGTFQINEAGAKLIGLVSGMGIKFMFEEAEPEDWYILSDPKGFVLREKPSGKKVSYITNSSFTAKKMLESHAIEKSSVSAKIKPQPIKINKQPAYLLLFIKR